MLGKNESIIIGETYEEKELVMAGLSPTQRTLKAMREQGRLCAIVEKFNSHVGEFGIRIDAFGFIDILAIDATDGIIAIQSCGQAFSEHVRKLTEERNENMYEWLKHAKCELWGWRKTKLKRGGKAMRWKPRIADFTLDKDNKIVVTERGKPQTAKPKSKPKKTVGVSGIRKRTKRPF